MSVKAYNEKNKNTNKYREKAFYCSQGVTFKSSFNEPKKSSSDFKNEKNDWKKLRDAIRSSPIFGEPEVLMYAGQLSVTKGIEFLKAIDIASDKIGKLREKVNKKYPSDDPASIEERDKEYYGKLFKLLKKS